MTSWGFLILSIISILLSFLLVQIHAEHRIKFINNCDKEKNNISENHWSNCAMGAAQLISGLFFVVGLIIFTIFVAINVK
jgi:hypothetical protein